MAGRQTYFFMLPEEFGEFIVEVIEKFEWGAAIQARRSESAQITFSTDPTAYYTPDISTVFIGSNMSSVSPEDLAQVSAARLGWVAAEVPRVKDDILLLTRIWAVTEWWEYAPDIRYVNETGFHLLKKIRALLAKRLKRPMWLLDRNEGPAVKYREFGFSQGAAEWVRSGRILQQVANAPVEFLIEEPHE